MICEICKEPYLATGSSYAGACERCADLTDGERFDGVDEAARRDILQKALGETGTDAETEDIEDAMDRIVKQAQAKRNTQAPRAR